MNIRVAAGKLAVMGLFVTLGGCAARFPPAAASVPTDVAFKARIAETYRPGTPAARLRADLLAQGFVVADDSVRRRHTATFEAGNLPCYSAVRIDWTEDRRGRIAEIQAARHDCS